MSTQAVCPELLILWLTFTVVLNPFFDELPHDDLNSIQSKVITVGYLDLIRFHDGWF